MSRPTTLKILTLILLGLAFSAEVNSYSPKTATVRAGGANLRAAPKTSGKVIGVLRKGARVQVLEKVSGVWYKVRHGDRNGFIHFTRLTPPARAAAPAPSPRTQEPAAARGGFEAVRREAVVAFYQKAWSEVIRLLHPWLRCSAAGFNDLFMLGIAFREVGQPANAVTALEQAIACQRGPFDTAVIEAYKVLGSLHLSLGRWSSAWNVYDRLLSQSPALDWALLGKGDACLAGGRIGEAIAEYEQAIRCNPERADGYFSLGQAFLASRQPEKAVKCYQAGLERRLNSEQAYTGLAQAYLQLGSFDAAREILSRAIGSFPHFRQVRQALETLGAKETLKQDLDAARQELAEVEEKVRLAGILVLEGRLVERLQPSLFEIALPSGKHAFLRTNTQGFPEQEAFTMHVKRCPDASISPDPRKGVEDPKTIPYFRQASEKDRLTYENLALRLEQKRAEVGRLTRKLGGEISFDGRRSEGPPHQATPDRF